MESLKARETFRVVEYTGPRDKEYHATSSLPECQFEFVARDELHGVPCGGRKACVVTGEDNIKFFEKLILSDRRYGDGTSWSFAEDLEKLLVDGDTLGAVERHSEMVVRMLAPALAELFGLKLPANFRQTPVLKVLKPKPEKVKGKPGRKPKIVEVETPVEAPTPTVEPEPYPVLDAPVHAVKPKDEEYSE